MNNRLRVRVITINKQTKRLFAAPSKGSCESPFSFSAMYSILIQRTQPFGGGK